MNGEKNVMPTKKQEAEKTVFKSNIYNKTFIINTLNSCKCNDENCENKSPQFHSIEFDGKLLARLTFKNCVKQDIKFENLSSVEGWFNFVQLKCKNIHFYPNNNLLTKSKNFGINITDSNINHFCFRSKNKNFSVEKFIISEMSTNDDGDYVIENLRVNEMRIKNFTNLSNRFVITDSIIDNLIIEGADLGKMRFNGVFIKSLTLENVTLNDCIFNGVEFPEKLEPIYISEKIENTEKQKDNYRQLKHVMDKNGNHTEANKFYAKEMQEYEKIITGSWNKLILKIQKIISNFGTSWIQAMMALFIWCTFCGLYLDLPYSSSKNKLVFESYDFIDYYNPIFLLPNYISINNSRYDIKYNGWEKFGFMIYKIVYGIILYQLIIAAKRTTRR